MHMVAARLGCKSAMDGTRWANSFSGCMETHLVEGSFLAGKAAWALSGCLTTVSVDYYKLVNSLTVSVVLRIKNFHHSINTTHCGHLSPCGTWIVHEPWISRVDEEFMSDGVIAYPLSVVSMRNVYQRSNCVQQFNHSSSTMQPSVL